MNDIAITVSVGFICLSSAFILGRFFKLRNDILLNHELLKQSNDLKTEISRAYKLLKSMEDVPENMIEEGLAGAGLAPLLEGLDINSLKSIIPAKYHMFLPVVQGFLDGIKKKGKVGGGETVAQPTFRGQSE